MKYEIFNIKKWLLRNCRAKFIKIIIISKVLNEFMGVKNIYPLKNKNKNQRWKESNVDKEMVSCTCNMSPENKGTDITWVQKIYILKQNTYKTPHLKRSGVAANYLKSWNKGWSISCYGCMFPSSYKLVRLINCGSHISWWDPSIVGLTSYERRETYTRNMVYFLEIKGHGWTWN